MNTQLDNINKQEMIETAIREEARKVDYISTEHPLNYFVETINQQEISDSLVWDAVQQSRFIESLLLRLPVLNIVVDADYRIIDGKQRIYTAVNFVNGNLRLERLKSLPTLNGFRFQDLILMRQRKFKRITVRIVELSPKSDISYWLDYHC